VAKPKKPKAPIEPVSIFKHALLFAETDNFLRSRGPLSPDGRVTPLAIANSTMLLQAFAIELLLKCILLTENKEPPPTHRLDKLHRQVSHKAKRRILELWDRDARLQLVQFAKDTGNPIDLPNALVKCGSAFDRLRYHYEDPEKTQFYLGGLLRVLIEVLLEANPEWRTLK
jgi:hypothetical protein